VDTQELRECTDQRLMDLEKTLRRQIFEARIKNFTNQLDDTASIRRARKDLARVKTILSERALEDADEGTEGAVVDEAEDTEEASAEEEAEETEE
jgi:large subunit ribosomal protein L29